MFVLASADAEQLERWRAAFGPEHGVVEVRQTDALLKCLRQLRPDVVLLDARLCGAVTAAARLVDQMLEERRGTKIVVFAPEGGDELELGLFLVGTRGFCLADAEPELVRRVAFRRASPGAVRGPGPRLPPGQGDDPLR